MRTLMITTEGLDDRSQIGDQQVFVSDLIDQAGHPDAQMVYVANPPEVYAAHVAQAAGH